MNPINTPQKQTPRDAKPEQESKVGDDRDGGSESSQAEKERRSNLAGDQDTDDVDDTRDLP